jgi:hypothetical protein
MEPFGRGLGGFQLDLVRRTFPIVLRHNVPAYLRPLVERPAFQAEIDIMVASVVQAMARRVPSTTAATNRDENNTDELPTQAFKAPGRKRTQETASSKYVERIRQRAEKELGWQRVSNRDLYKSWGISKDCLERFQAERLGPERQQEMRTHIESVAFADLLESLKARPKPHRPRQATRDRVP